MTDPTQASAPALCWICNTNPADSGEHRFKATDIRARAAGISQQNPIRMHHGVKQLGNDKINVPVASAKSTRLMFERSICKHCNNARTAPYDDAWQQLSEELTGNWRTIREAGRLNLMRPFPHDTQALAIDVHLYFVKMLGCKIFEDRLALDLKAFAQALMTRRPHPEIGLMITEAPAPREILAWNSEVYTLREKNSGSIDGATWLYLMAPFAVKVIYMRAGRPLRPPTGMVWYPTKRRRIVELSPYESDPEPLHGLSEPSSSK
jgi:hypothetical protein